MNTNRNHNLYANYEYNYTGNNNLEFSKFIECRNEKKNMMQWYSHYRGCIVKSVQNPNPLSQYTPHNIIESSTYYNTPCSYNDQIRQLSGKKFISDYFVKNLETNNSNNN